MGAVLSLSSMRGLPLIKLTWTMGSEGSGLPGTNRWLATSIVSEAQSMLARLVALGGQGQGPLPQPSITGLLDRAWLRPTSGAAVAVAAAKLASALVAGQPGMLSLGNILRFLRWQRKRRVS